MFADIALCCASSYLVYGMLVIVIVLVVLEAGRGHRNR